MDNIINDNLIKLPTIALRGIVVFPGMSAHFEVGRRKSLNAIGAALQQDKRILLVTQKDVRVDDPRKDDLYEIGVVAIIRQVLNMPGNTARILVEGLSRAYVNSVSGKDYLVSTAEIINETEDEADPIGNEALIRACGEEFERYSEFVPKMSGDIFANILTHTDCGKLADYIMSNIMVATDKKQDVLSTLDHQERLIYVVNLLAHEREVLSVEKGIKKLVSESMDKNQREYYLREQIKAIYEELGVGEEAKREIERFHNRALDSVSALGLPEASTACLHSYAKALLGRTK